MPTTKTPAAKRGKKGSFANSHDSLLSHFAVAGEAGERSWRESFGYERRPDKPKGGKPFIARGSPRSSPGSK
ncbi:MAG TPA: hypothetical protein VFO12_02390 [Sphingomicrobium sp.]|nr:hypothetical protein [Sphingomicrobium sp.]